LEAQTDSWLMKSVQAGDSSQLAVLFERHHQALFRYLLHLTRNRALSEDLVQEVFFRVLKYAQSYNPELAFPVWIYGMARNAYYDSLHKRRGEAGSLEMLGEMKSHDPMPEELAARKQDAALLLNAMAQLPEEKREVLVLSRFHEMRHEDIARVMQCEVGTVRVRIYRALKELRQHVVKSMGEKVYDA
jgi:RNA polymerase sigma-70 factor (ECF subfamily)